MRYTNEELVGNGREVFAGGEPRYLSRVKPAGATLGHCGLKPFAASGIEMIPESDWAAMVKDREARKMWPKNLIDFGPLDQNGTNYCWVNAVTGTAMCCRRRMGLKHVDLSPASVGGPIKGYSNVGGWGGEAYEYGSKNGWVPCSKWGANAISRSNDTEETRALREHFRILEGFIIESKAEAISALLQGFDLFVGYAWWSHEVQISRLYLDGSTVYPEIWNSWGGGWGTKNEFGIGGFSELGAKGWNFDDCGLVSQMTPYNA